MSDEFLLGIRLNNFLKYLNQLSTKTLMIIIAMIKIRGRLLRIKKSLMDERSHLYVIIISQPCSSARLAKKILINHLNIILLSRVIDYKSNKEDKTLLYWQ